MKINKTPFQSIKLIALDRYFDELVDLYNSNFFPKVLMLNGKKGIGKFTLIFHLLNYIYSKKEKTFYNKQEKLIDINSNFYKSVLNKTCSDIIFLNIDEGENIKIDDIRNLKSVLSRSSLSNKPRFVVIDEVEYINSNSANALLKTLEEPSANNYFVLINNQQSDLIETISSRCLKNNIYLNSNQREKIINYLFQNEKIDSQLEDSSNLTPGLFLQYNNIYNKYKIDNSDKIYIKLNKLLYGYKKDKDKTLIKMSLYLVDQFFYILIKNNENKFDYLLNLKSIIIDQINDFTVYNLNIKSILNFIELKLKDVR
ncbi:AAA family ATPase [Pelagibacteraceae bacterium]|nr:AAA family ATPase [Pelagibacteraceae bacterium]